MKLVEQFHVFCYLSCTRSLINFISKITAVRRQPPQNSVQIVWIMFKVFYLIAIILPFIEGSLNDYKRCQKKHDCTQTLNSSDCPPGQFLDVKFSNECCHGCRSGIGQYIYIYKNWKLPEISANTFAIAWNSLVSRKSVFIVKRNKNYLIFFWRSRWKRM